MLKALMLTILLLTTALAAEEKEKPTILDQLLSRHVAQGSEIAPDGKYVAYTVFTNDFENDRDMSQLWIANTEKGEPTQFTYAEESVGEIEWSADSQWLLFMRNDELSFIKPKGGEAIVSKLELKGVSNFRFSSDSKTLYFLAREGEKTDEQKVIKAREKHYGEYEVVRHDGNYRHLWKVKLTDDMRLDGEPEQLTSGRDFHVSGYSLSPDTQTITFVTWPSPHRASLLNGKLYSLSVEGGEPSLLDERYGVKSPPIWHVNGQRFAYTNAEGFPDYSDVILLDVGSGKSTVIETPKHNANLRWYSKDGLYFTSSVKTHLGLYKLTPKSEKISLVSDQDTFVGGVTFARDGQSYAFQHATPKTLREIAVKGKRRVKVLTNFSAQLEGQLLPSKELIQWTSDNGLEIEGVLTKPYDYDPDKSYPLYVRTHGGPTGTDRPLITGSALSIFHPEALVEEGEGALVLQTNYRGSAGYGEEFQMSNLKNLGIGPARDIIAGVKVLVDKGMVDPNRVACLGWSQGGHISAMLSTYSDICSAAIMGAGISDWRTYYYNTDITQFTTEYFKATPYEDDAVYAKTSPVTYIENAKTPVLIQHGENDARVPIANGYQFRQLLHDKGVESEMLIYANMGHGPSSPKTRRAITQHALEWFRHYLFDTQKKDYVFPYDANELESEEN